MHGDLGRRKLEDQSATSHVDMRILQNIPEEDPVRFRVTAVDDDVPTIDHAPRVGPDTFSAVLRRHKGCRGSLPVNRPSRAGGGITGKWSTVCQGGCGPVHTGPSTAVSSPGNLPGQMPVDRRSCHHHQPTSGVMTTCGLEPVPMVLAGGGDAVQDAIGRGLRSPEHGHHLTRRQVGTPGCGHQQDSVSQWQPARPARLPITAAAPHQRHQLPELGFGRLGERLAHSSSIATNSAGQTRPVSAHFLCSHGCRPGGVAIRSRFTTGSAASDFGHWPGAQPWVTSVAVVFFVLARVGAPSAQKITPVTMKTASGTASVSR